MTLIESHKSARRVSTPLVAIQTPDPVATIQRVAADVAGDAPKVQRDFCSGLSAVNPQGEEAIAIACACPACSGAGETDEGVCQTCDGRRMLFSPTDSRANPAGVLAMLRSMPATTMAFIQNAHRFLGDVGFIRFDDLGGLAAIKEHLRLVLNGRNRPNCLVWVDEGDKAFAVQNDLNGLGADQIGMLLSYMEDRRARGFILFGGVGTGKSMIAKAAGSEAGIPTVQCDLGARMGSLVGQSQQAVRSAVKVIDAISGGRSLWILTCNRIDVLPPELQARFSCGTYYFSSPTEEERASIWAIQKAAYGITDDTSDMDIDSTGWVGRDIRNCCDAAWDTGMSIREASRFVNPVGRSCHKDIENRELQADGKFLDASQSGVYVRRITRDSAVRSVACSR